MSTFEQDTSELEKFILDQIDYYDKGVDEKLATLVSDVTRDLQNGNYQNRTGSLRRSIRVALEGDNMFIRMNNYGYFLSFGVNGQNRKNADPLSNDVATAFGVREGYKFGSNKVWGIAPRRFYPTDIEEQLINILQNEE